MITVKVEKDGQVSEASLDPTIVEGYKIAGTDLIEDTKNYLLRGVNVKVRAARGDMQARAVYTVTIKEVK